MSEHDEPVQATQTQATQIEEAQTNVNHAQDSDILAAQQKRRIWVFALAGLGGLLVLGYLVWLFLAKGYQIMVNPEHARATAQVELVSGAGFVLSNKIYTFSGNTVVAVSAAKFIRQEVVINPESPAVIDVTLMPAPVQLSFSVAPDVEDSAVNKTEWRVNGRLVASGARLQWDVPPGDIQVELNHPWYETQSWQGSGGPADEISESFSLLPVQGSISFASQPSGAEIFVNEQRVGSTPLTLQKPGGEYQVEIRLDGYQAITDILEVKNRNLNPNRNYLLIPEQGAIEFSLEPKGGLLSINNAPQDGQRASVDANVAHRIRYEKTGFKSQVQTVNLKPGEVRNLTLTLAPEYGTVNLSSSLPAEVQINGKTLGQTPLQLNLQTIEQEVHFVRSGYRTVVKTLTPDAGKPADLFAEMLSEFDARQKEGKPLFISGLGIEVKRFRPRAYIMGSPDNEAYRRRNEHRKSVEFNRQIWVSKHEITEAQFAEFRASVNKEQGDKSNLPVTDITWLEAAEFCHWLSIQEGLEPFYLFENGQLRGINPAARGYRLPTEAEWEWLAKIANRRAPTKYSWGSQERIPKEYGNYADETVKANGKYTLAKYDDGFAEKAPVGSFKADRTGLFDLDGNVAEWVHDKYTLQPPDLSRTYLNYLGMQRGNANVIKGASYDSGRYRDLRVARRDEGTEGSPTVGFRIARYE